MRDGIIKGTGNSRYLKTVSDALTRWPTYDSFMRAMVAGTFLADLYGLNSAGWQDIGTTLNKAALLSDATANAIGTAGEIDTPDKALAKLRQLVKTAQDGVNNGVKITQGTYTGTGTYGSSNENRLYVGFSPKMLFITPSGRESIYIIRCATGGAFLVGGNGATMGHYGVFSRVSGSYVYWYSSINSYGQANNSGIIYDYTVIG